MAGRAPIILCFTLACATTPTVAPPPSAIPECEARPRQLLGPKLTEAQYRDAIERSETSSIAGHLAALIVEMPKDPSAHRSFALVLTELGDPAGSVVHYRCALSLDPSLPGARIELAAQLVDAAAYDDARIELLRDREKTEPDFRARSLMASALEGLGQLRAAADELARAAEETKTSAVLYRRAAELYARAGESILAEDFNSRADQIDPPPTPRKLRQLPESPIRLPKKKKKKK